VGSSYKKKKIKKRARKKLKLKKAKLRGSSLIMSEVLGIRDFFKNTGEMSGIVHVVALPDEVEDLSQTSLQGFSLCLHDYQNLLFKLAGFPKDLIEAFLESEEYIEFKRHVSCSNIILVRKNQLDYLLSLRAPVMFVWSVGSTFESAQQFCEKSKSNPVHLCTEDRSGSYWVFDVSRDKIYEIIILKFLFQFNN